MLSRLVSYLDKSLDWYIGVGVFITLGSIFLLFTTLMIITNSAEKRAKKEVRHDYLQEKKLGN